VNLTRPYTRTPLTVDSNPAEYMPLAETYSPVLHRLDLAVRFRAVQPNEPIPPPYDILTRYSNPPDELLTKAKRQLQKLVEAANVKKGNSPFHPIPPPSIWFTKATHPSPPQNPIPQTRPRRHRPPLRPRHRLPPRPRPQAAKNLHRQPDPLVPPTPRHGRLPRRDTLRC